MKLLKIGVTAALALGLTACGGSSDDEKTVSSNNGGSALDRCVEQAILNGAKTGAEALELCGVNIGGSTNNGSAGNGSNGGSTNTQTKKIHVKAISILSDYTTEDTYSNHGESIIGNAMEKGIITGFVICDNTTVATRSFDFSFVEYGTILNEWKGDKNYDGFYMPTLRANDDNCLIQSTNYLGHIPSNDFVQNTIYRNGEVAYIDLASALTMARLMGTDSYGVPAAILDGQTKNDIRDGFNSSIKTNFAANRNKLPSNEKYKEAEQELIASIKKTNAYSVISGKVDEYLATVSTTDERYNAYQNVKERAKLVAALYAIQYQCGNDCSSGTVLASYADGNSFETVFKLNN